MALDYEPDTVGAQFAGLRVDVETRPHPQATKPASSVSVAVSSPTDTESLAANEEAAGAARTFPHFPLLPAELRLKIWHMSFLPRTVELHRRRSHYADNDRGSTPKWQSQSRNPAALSVSAEARAAALECYTVALPLAAPPPSRQKTSERPGDLLLDGDRVLYLNLERDTVVVLGDLQCARLVKLLDWFRRSDSLAARRWENAGTARGGKGGLRRLAMSVAPWTHEVGAAALKAFARTLFADLDEFVLFMYSERLPPPAWTGGPCVLEEASADADYYRRFLVGRGRQFRSGDGWMAVGQRPMKVADIRFDDGW